MLEAEQNSQILTDWVCTIWDVVVQISALKRLLWACKLIYWEKHFYKVYLHSFRVKAILNHHSYWETMGAELNVVKLPRVLLDLALKKTSREPGHCTMHVRPTLPNVCQTKHLRSLHSWWKDVRNCKGPSVCPRARAVGQAGWGVPRNVTAPTCAASSACSGAALVPLQREVSWG